jgi:hypothetical protein
METKIHEKNEISGRLTDLIPYDYPFDRDFPKFAPNLKELIRINPYGHTVRRKDGTWALSIIIRHPDEFPNAFPDKNGEVPIDFIKIFVGPKGHLIMSSFEGWCEPDEDDNLYPRPELKTAQRFLKLAISKLESWKD